MEHTMDELKEELEATKMELENLYDDYDFMMKANTAEMFDLKKQLEAAGRKHFADADKTAPDVSEIVNKNGLPIVSGDVVYGEDGKKWTVAGFDFGSEHSVVAFNGKSAKKLRPEWLTRRKPDTQEDINADATMPPRAYYAEKIGHDVGLKDEAECTEAMIRDLLKRQRELCGRAAK